MTPKYCFQVVADYKVGDNKLNRSTKSFETIGMATSVAEQCKREVRVRRVQVICVLDDWTKSQEIG